MKKISFLITAVCCIAFTFSGCVTDEPKTTDLTTIVAKSIKLAPSNEKVDSVHAVMVIEDNSTVIARTTYQDAGFTIKVPSILPDDYLTKLDDMPEGITVSDKEAKINLILTFPAIKDKKEVGLFQYSKITISAGNMTLAFYIYADRPTQITGSFSETDDFLGLPSTKGSINVSLKKGWNLMGGKGKITLGGNGIKDIQITTITDTSEYTWSYIPIASIPSI